MANEVQQIQVLKSALAQAKEKLVAQDVMLKRLTAEPLRFATVISVKPEKKVEKGEFGIDRNVRVLRGKYTGKIGKIYDLIGDSTAYVDVEGSRIEFTLDSNTSDRQGLLIELVNPNAAPIKGAEIRVVADRRYPAGTLGVLDRDADERNVASARFDKAVCLSDRRKGCSHDFFVDAPSAIEPIGAVSYGTAIVLFDGKEVEVTLPPEKEVRVGDTAKLSTQTLQIVDVVETKFAGEIVGVQRVLDSASSEVEFQGGTRAVYNGRFDGKLKAGDRVVLDPSGLVIIRNLGQEDRKDDFFAFTENTNVTWDDIGGLIDAKREMIEAIELPYRFGQFYSFYGKKPLKGVLLYGPPGCGKTMLGKAAATSLSKLHEGKGTDTCFMYIKAPEILNKFIGASEANIRRIFAAARRHKEQHGYPAVVFIDEADAILRKRGTGMSFDMERTIVPMFLAEMDGFDESGAIVMLATNRADTLDPAIVREGRISRKIKISRPDAPTGIDLFRLKLEGIPLYNGSTHQQLAEMAAKNLFSPERVLYHAVDAKREKHPFLFANLVSGAMIAEIVDQATSLAMHRDIAAGKPTGMKAEDLSEAIDCAFRQNRDLNHDDDLNLFSEQLGTRIVALERPAAA
jgi:proteasome-associated ATPase